MKLSNEQQKIVSTDGNVLVIANPGTGKTTLLGFKYIELIRRGILPKDILCLTFTKKAQNELEEKILNLLQSEELKISLTDIQVYTFHSYAANFLDTNILNTNLMRYKIFDYLRKNEIFYNEDEYLINDIVPKLENFISYLKSFGITPNDIEVKKISDLIEKNKIEEIDSADAKAFIKQFYKIYKFYEDEKVGRDYNDLLIEFYKILQNETEKFKKYKYVLVDELQDLNKIESDIVLLSGENFVAVGDKKQAIFGFQGGSITNFEKFKNSTQFILSENFRSTNEILNFSRDYFIQNTKDENHKNELEHLKNNIATKSTKPEIIKTGKDKITKEDNTFDVIYSLIEKLKSENKKTAIIARTNSQLEKISKELTKNSIEHSSTSFGDSTLAKKQIILFLKSILSDDLETVKSSIFSIYSVVNLQRAFELSKLKHKTLNEFFIDCPELKKLREKISNLQNLNQIFVDVIFPVSILHGETFYLAANSAHNAFLESIEILNEKNFKNVIDYISTSIVNFETTEVESDLILTTVHKAKGKQFDNVIYLPQATKKSNFHYMDFVIEEILNLKKLNVKEEIEEETLRINFVAFTRAKSKLFILTDLIENFLNDSAIHSSIENLQSPNSDFKTKSLLDYNNFLMSNFIDSKTGKIWLDDFIKKYFESLNTLSYSRVTKDPFDFLKRNILKISEPSNALKTGTMVHEIAQNIFNNTPIKISDDEVRIKNFQSNIEKVFLEILKTHPEKFSSEMEFKTEISKFTSFNESLKFVGKIDAIFKNDDEYLIIDWKTDKNISRASEHRRQLEVYKKAFSSVKNIPIEKIKIGIAFIGLRDSINEKDVRVLNEPVLDLSQPKSSVFNTFENYLKIILDWKKDYKLFLEDLKNSKIDDTLLQNILNEFEK